MLKWKMVRTVLLTDVYGRTVEKKVEEVGLFKTQKEALKYVVENDLFILDLDVMRKIIFLNVEIRRK